MKLTVKQSAVLKAMTTEWQTPTQIARVMQMQGTLDEHKSSDYWVEMNGSSYVNQPLKALIRKGLVKMNPDKRGQYRLTPGGVAIQETI
ncbi:hypothetical protein [Brevibacillus fulvus]|uniref:Uncharacterized protein n=1 Tax=Brevibacillus fulvus TaxID=1125967 RepID=A0A938Y0T0_9BACL|nr:hypothetical protein [Brevibacillus fulvus]MBM7591230.1 hypothetical protein [Brevibacillus fulvus]